MPRFEAYIAFGAKGSKKFAAFVIDMSMTWIGAPPRLYSVATETRTKRVGGHSDAPEAIVVERARGHGALGARRRDGGGGGACTVYSPARHPRGGNRSTQIPRSDGMIAYLTLLNARDGGIN